jgi:hypothetical protein
MKYLGRGCGARSAPYKAKLVVRYPAYTHAFILSCFLIMIFCYFYANVPFSEIMLNGISKFWVSYILVSMIFFSLLFIFFSYRLFTQIFIDEKAMTVYFFGFYKKIYQLDELKNVKFKLKNGRPVSAIFKFDKLPIVVFNDLALGINELFDYLKDIKK